VKGVEGREREGHPPPKYFGVEPPVRPLGVETDLLLQCVRPVAPPGFCNRGGESEVWAYRGSRVRRPPEADTFTAVHREFVGFDNETTHILHNFWTSTHRGEASPSPRSLAPLCAAVSACIDIDECSYYNGGCSSHAFCNNTAAGYSCNCHPGYTGDGVHCAGPYHIHSCQHTVLTVFAGTLAQLFSRSTCVQSALDAFRNVHRIFVRGVNARLPPEVEKILKM